jgi:hypothetical protein
VSYPTLPIMENSYAERLGGFEPRRASNGVLKIRRLYSAEKTNFTVEHWLSQAQKDALEAAYQTHKTGHLSFTWPEDGVVYTVQFAAAPQYRREPGYWVANVLLLEV